MFARLSHILLLVSAILAFVPVLVVDYFLDTYVNHRESDQLQEAVEAVTTETQKTVTEGVDALRRVLDKSPSLCSPTFINNAQKELQASQVLRQFAVSSDDGVQLCQAFGQGFAATPLSETVSIAGSEETITVVQIEGQSEPALQISALVRPRKLVSVYTPVNPQLLFGHPQALAGATLVRISLTNGNNIATFGDPKLVERSRHSSSYIRAEAIAGSLPIRVEAAVPFGAVRIGYADLDVGFTFVACLMSAAFLWLSLQYVRRTNVPVFNLERAIMAGQLKPRYQPVINLNTGEIAGCEVLIRWEKPSGEIISPGAFIEYAEMSGLAIPMTLSLMEQVRDDLEPLSQEQPLLKISINLFEGHFRDGTIVDDVKAIFEGSSVEFNQLVFEITERQPLEDMADANQTIAELHRLGVRVALDDAGTGHSNLAYLQTMGIDIIKIDKVFVDLIKSRSEPVPVVDALIAMAKDLGTDIIAEGVETEEQALYLRSHGVVFAQGYLFAPALPLPDYLLLARQLNANQTITPDDALGASQAA